MDTFEVELLWCIQQLELGISTQKSNSKKVEEAVKVLSILKSPKAPVIKKRQAMRNAFGDYRKKMKDEEKKSESVYKALKITSKDSSMSQKSLFVRKSKLKSTDQVNERTEDDSVNEGEQKSEEECRTETHESKDERAAASGAESNRENAIPDEKLSKPTNSVSVNYFVMKKRTPSEDNSFQFQFDTK